MVDGLRTFVLDEGMGDPVVLLHGIPTQAYLWRDVARVVVRAHRVIAPDLLGFGFADRPATADLSPVGQADYLDRVLAELRVDRFGLVTHDYGALVGAELIARAADRVTHLVISNTSLAFEDWSGGRVNPLALLAAPGVGETAFRLTRPFMLTQAFRIYTADKQRLTRETMRVYWHPFSGGFSGVLLRLSREHRMTRSDFARWRDALVRFDRPGLVVWGDRDPTFRRDRALAIARLLPNAGLEIFQHASHFVPEDRPEAFGRLVLGLLQQ
jgi:pimeloyl-ACP methyl ester carboxylesterase